MKSDAFVAAQRVEESPRGRNCERAGISLTEMIEAAALSMLDVSGGYVNA